MSRHPKSSSPAISIFDSPRGLLVRMKTYQLKILLKQLERADNMKEARLVRAELARRAAG